MLQRRHEGAAPRLRLPKGAVDTQMHVYLPGYPALPGGPGLPPDPLPQPEDYRKVMGWLGIDRFVITQGNAHQRENACLLACLARFPDLARGVAVIDGATDDAELRRLDAAGIVGARVMELNGGAVGLAALEEVDARAHAMGWMLAVQFDGSDILEHEPRLARLKSRWVLDHHGKIFRDATPDGPEMAAIRRLIDGGNVWYKIAGCYESSRDGPPDYADTAAMTRAVATHAPERIVWGTNWPHNLARTTADYPDDAALLDVTLGWLADDAARRLALIDNPEALFGGRLPPLAG
ncbi:amidohydrolase family protein [Acidimangrovimonas pyrenivorans]|uniref:Amidohydrolase family protein n=1 Tax=Acidimangrovimonas pyrenivorans TaxID=2030798 RepID=A0ABV7AIY3_9RHOB